MKLPRLSPQAPFLLTLLLPTALVAIAVVLTAYQHLAACPLCIVQRMLYLVIALVSIGGLVFRRRTLRGMSSAGVALISLAGAGVAGYQVYLQKNPFAATCGAGNAWWERMIEQAGNFSPLLFRADGLCSDDSWKLLGLSLAEWSVAAFVGFFLLAICSLFFRNHE